jgi:glycosyltransferase involved in cell wall biosynthesis
LDDGSDKVEDLIPTDYRIRYVYESPKKNHGEKMNRCMELARGEICIVWDDDDWYAFDRVSKHVAAFADPEVHVAGTSRLYYYIHGTKQAFRYQNWTIQPWLGAFAVRKRLWDEGLKFDPIKAGADVHMLNSIPQEHWKDLNDLSLMVATVHPENASAKNIPNISFIETPWDELEKITEGCLESF